MIPGILRKTSALLAGFALLAAPALSQNTTPAPAETRRLHVELTLEEAIRAAQEQSIAAMVAKYTFLSSYWSFRSFRASRLPSLNLSGEVLSFDRSLRLLQDYDTGEMRYLENYNLQNTIGLSIRQNIALTGGTLQLYSSLNRLDQFAPKDSKSYYSQPITLSYTQPLFAYNQFKWDKKIAPKEYELAKRTYIEAMEDVTTQAVSYYFALLLSKTRHEIAVKNYDNTKALYAIAEKRLKLGSITHDELLQLQLRMLNDSLSINDTSLEVREQQMRFNSYLRYNENVEVAPVLDDRIPAIDIDYAMVLDKALENSSFDIGNQIQMLNAESDIARARAERGASASRRPARSSARPTRTCSTRRSSDSSSPSRSSTGAWARAASAWPGRKPRSSATGSNRRRSTTATRSTRSSSSSSTSATSAPWPAGPSRSPNAATPSRWRTSGGEPSR